MELVDQISDLPEFILHIILSFLDANEACRAGVLSKKWQAVWSSMPVLDFQPQYFKKGGSMDSGKFSERFYNFETLLSYMEFINTTMERYSKQKHGIKKFTLEFPMVNDTLKPIIDKWIEIAVRNKVEELEISILVEESLDYKLPEFLFSARSLRVLKCTKVQLPNYPTMKLFCLEKLILNQTTIEDDMLQRIISFCPLVDIQFRGCSALENIFVPWVKRSPEDNEVAKDIKTSALENFFYLNHFQCPWPWNMNMTALRNLRKLQISSADITDDIVSELTAGLSVLEILFISTCLLLKCVKISSISLKGFSIVGCHNLEKLTIDTPNLVAFLFNVEFKLVPSINIDGNEFKPALSIINVHDCCDAHLFAWVLFPCTEWFIKFHEFLVKTNMFKTLEMSGGDPEYQITVDKDHLRRINTGTPCKLKEFKLFRTCDWELEKSSLVAFLDGLFWSCHPDVLTIPTSFQNATVEMILGILKNKVRCWKDPLKGIEVEVVKYARLLLYSSEVEIRLRLSW
ncbi:uncharacterized protein LOC141606665 [Silene latifolia]|uniref:uncharacterized protein LOC141606665 n=1 Tax=Silene latifolia TaxID=37657 RepID=UPI003D78A242